MTRNQLELIKNGTYFFLVLGLGGSVLWLSSGGNVFQSDVVGQVNTNVVSTTADGTVVGGLLGAVATTNANINTTLSSTALISPVTNANTNTESTSLYSAASNSNTVSTNVNASSFSNDFADLTETTYTSELSGLQASAYTSENTTESTPNTLAETSKPAPQIITTTPAKAPKSGPEEVILVILAALISSAVLFYKKLLRVS